MTEPTALGAWVAKCEACGTVYPLPRFPTAEYATSQPLIRPDDFDSASIPCFCGQVVSVDRNSLTFVGIVNVEIHRVSPDEFQVERHYAGAKTDLGPMSDVQLERFLGTHNLVGVLPTQVIQRLKGSADVSIQIVVAVVRPALATAS